MIDFKKIIAQNSELAKQEVSRIHRFIHGKAAGNAYLGFDTSSKVSEWRLWVEVVSFVSYLQQLLWGEAKAEMNEIKAQAIAANKYFFAREWRKFQYGDSLLVNDQTGKYYYRTLDQDKQIIKRLAILQGSNQWSVKVATENAEGKPVALTPAQLEGFQGYIDRTQPPGAQVRAISLNSDKLAARFTVYYNALESLEKVKKAVEAAYLDYLSQIDIDGESVYYISKHVDALQACVGVVDVQVNRIQAKVDGQAYRAVVRKYEPFSGYLEHDTDLSLSDVINYVSE